MDNNKNNIPDDDNAGEIMSWIITFILLIAFWPVGLILLLKKLNVFSKHSGKASGRANRQSSNSARRAQTQYKQSARDAETAAREAAADIAHSAREAGQAARQAISEIYADLTREFAQYQPQKSRAAQDHTAQDRTAQDWAAQDRTAQDGTAQDHIAQDWAAQDRAAHDGSAQDGTVQDHIAQDWAAQDRTAHDRTTQDHTTQDRTETDTAAQPRQAKQTRSQAASTQATRPQVSQSPLNQSRNSSAEGYQPGSAQPGHSSDRASQTGSTYRDASRNAARQAGSVNTKKRKKRSALEKKSGRVVSVILLLISIALFILGVSTIDTAAREIWINGVNRWPDFFMGIFFFIGGLISFFARGIGVRRLARYKRYYAYISDRASVPVSDIAGTTGMSERVVRRDIQAMITAGYLGRDAYMDRKVDCLILSSEGAEAAHSAVGAERVPTAQATEEKPQNQYMALIQELREINNSIADVAISAKVDRIEEVTAKIFRAVEEDPEKLPLIRRFMGYYLPTTQKLLRSYATLEKQGIKGENITSAKDSIGRILDTLATGFEQQLDQLFSADALDIASDINVLENLMHQDGLTTDKPELKTMESV